MVADPPITPGATEEGFMGRTKKQQREFWRDTAGHGVATRKSPVTFFEPLTPVRWARLRP
jgi:hypothetical protein